MGLFDIFRKKDAQSENKDLIRLQKMVSNKLSQNLDREDALHRLADMHSPEAARVLLTRFNWTLNPSIKDQEEKEVAMRGIVAAGIDALPQVRAYCTRAEALTWPLRALRSIVKPEELEGELLSLLDEFDTDYVRNPEPKIQLLQALSDFASEQVRIATIPFMTDASEEVRFAAVSAVLGCNSPSSLESLVEALADEESLRIKNRIASGIVEQAIPIPEAVAERLRQACPPGFAISEGRLKGRPRN